MGQVNVTYDDAMIAKIDALAEQHRMTRPDLLRAIAAQALGAQREGLELFEATVPPLDAGGLKELVVSLERMAMELDRALRDQDRREKRLHQAFHAAEEGRQGTLAGLSQQVLGRLTDGETPFRIELVRLREGIEAQHQRGVDALAATVSPLAERMAGLEKRLRDMPRSLVLDFGTLRLRPGELWLLWGIGIAVITVSQVALAWLLPNAWFATPLAARLFGSSEVGICELYKHAHDLEHCPTFVVKDRRTKR